MFVAQNSLTKMCCSHSMPEGTLTLFVTIELMYSIGLSFGLSIANFLKLILVNCWKKCVTEALLPETGDITTGKNMFEIVFSLFREILKFQFQKQNKPN